MRTAHRRGVPGTFVLTVLHCMIVNVTLTVMLCV